VEASRLARQVACSLAVLVAACGGGGGGGGSGVGLEDLNLDGQIVILAFGDSITRGVGDGPGADSTPPSSVAGYPARLQQLLAPRTQLPLVVINDGSSGERTRTGLPRLRRDLPRNPVDYVILLEGSNDVEEGNIPQAASNMQAMVDAVFGVGAQPILGTIPPSCCAHRNALSFGADQAYNGQLRSIATADMLPLIDFYAAFTNGPGPNGEDLPFDQTLGLIHVPEGLHPTSAGYDLMAQTAWKLFVGS
jgi:lysophospholipase L1-like esterase